MAYEYKDARLEAIEEEEKAALAKTDQVYGQLLSETKAGYDQLIALEEDYKQDQSQAQQENTELEVLKLQQEQADAKEEYDQEQSAAYTDYQNQVNPYGVTAETLAANGLSGSGYSESTKAGMFNAYQNRVAVARQGYAQAVRDYDLAIREAWRLNSVTLAKIAYETLKRQTELAKKAMEDYAQLQLKWQDRRWDQQEQYRNWEEEMKEEVQENPDYVGVSSPKMNIKDSDLKVQS